VIHVTWPPSGDPTTASYKLQSSPDAASWVDLATVLNNQANPALYDATEGVFYYDDAGGSDATWYRIATISTLAVQGAWSEPMQPPAVYVPPWDDAGGVVNSAAVEVGLDEVTDPFTSTDPNIKQLCWLLKSLGRDLVHMRSWNHLRKEHSFTTVAGQSTYSLPNDYHNMIDQTWWNRTNRLPVGGPLSAQEWQYLKGRLTGVVFNVLFRPMNRAVTLYPDTNTPGGFDIAFEYNSSYWVSRVGAPDTTVTDVPSNSSDLVWFDPLLLTRGLKLAFLKAKGFDTTAAQQDWNMSLEYVKGNDASSPILSATRRGARGMFDPLLGDQSIPITNYGL
jgi:hypothetical protein